ncbi:hypothetical protein CYMTET_41805 [Cymbomonas tetramitiformis]|uniref:Uncharacterized protein n=1 Tax=Cymbomonas tetramitiformis TaxID=36881 RepID=A0AAE0F379_9CHLO|nr:hypothetical protein CYMTET_41805 [Cymbomonas tetramitiformis]
MSQFSKTWFGTLKTRFENDEDLSSLKFRVFAICESKSRSLSRTKDKQPVVSVTFRDAPGDVLMATGWRLMAGATLQDVAPLLEHVEVGKLYDIYMSSETFYNLSLASSYELSRNIADISGAVQTLEAIVEVTKDLPHAFIKEWGLPSTWISNRQVLTIDNDSEDEDYVTPPPPPPKRRKGKGKAKIALPFPDGTGASCAGASEAPTGAAPMYLTMVAPPVGDVGDPIPEEVPAGAGDIAPTSQAPNVALTVAPTEDVAMAVGAGETGAGVGAVDAGAVDAVDADADAVATGAIVNMEAAPGAVTAAKKGKKPKAKQN